MPPRPSKTLTEAELRLMRLLWSMGECSVQDLVSALPADSKLAYTSILTTIRILENKGYVVHRQAGRAFLYSSRIAEHQAQQTEVRHVMNRFFGDSRERLMLAILGDGEVKEEELERLKQLIATAENSANNPPQNPVARPAPAEQNEGRQ
ncbi:BlaI/MecI/CopY family transcriptional regulator [Granulicella paludicola]|uniref:BlaI/MecI/CopY family transcriptional regulator n=1 Tax=Granulicella paludicola TaxID=474951 RepID=UPI0021E0077A|nr:BlaI/MecI/CopY family transcriptional regulator [Granulicella paludicola]